MSLSKNNKNDVAGRAIRLCENICAAARDSVATLWSAFLEVGELDMVRATEKALRLLVSHGDYAGAMKVLEGICALVEIAPSEDFTACQRHEPLSQMFMEEFLGESEDFIFDEGMDGVMELLMNENR